MRRGEEGRNGRGQRQLSRRAIGKRAEELDPQRREASALREDDGLKPGNAVRTVASGKHAIAHLVSISAQLGGRRFLRVMRGV